MDNLGEPVEREIQDGDDGREALGKTPRGLQFVGVFAGPFALSGAWGEPSLEGCESDGPDRLSLSQVRFRPRPIARLPPESGGQTGSPSVVTPVVALAGRAVGDWTASLLVPLGAFVVRRPTAGEHMRPWGRRGHPRDVVRTWSFPSREVDQGGIIGGSMSDVKGESAMKVILDLAEGLANQMATISLHVVAGPDPKGEGRLLEQWRETHRQVAIAHHALRTLADMLAASDCHTITRIR